MAELWLIIWSFAILIGFWWLYRLFVTISHLIVMHFGIDTTAHVIHTQRRDENGEAFLHGYYVFKDLHGQEHTFAFKICCDWPADEQWYKLIQLYTQGTHNRVRYLRWLPFLHEMQPAT